MKLSAVEVWTEMLTRTMKAAIGMWLLYLNKHRKKNGGCTT